jgi:hypothetical protein
MTKFNYTQNFLIYVCSNISKKSYAHFQCVHKNCAKFEERQLKGLHKAGTQYEDARLPGILCATRPKKPLKSFQERISQNILDLHGSLLTFSGIRLLKSCPGEGA